MTLYGFNVKIISYEHFDDEKDGKGVCEVTDHVFVQTMEDAINIVRLLANMNKEILSIEITEVINPDNMGD